MTEHHEEQRSAEWFERRKGRVTGSSVGAILGLDPFRTRDDVMRMMVRDNCGAEREFTGNIATEWGANNEAGAKIDFQMETGLDVVDCGFFTFEDWLGASPDGLVGVNALLEIKCPFGKRKDEKPAFKSFVDQGHYYAQIQICLFCTGREMTYFYQWAPNGSMTEEVIYDPLWIAENVPRLAQFYAEYLDELNDPAKHLEPLRMVIDTPQAHKMAAEYDELAEQIERATERKKDLLAEMVTLAKDRDAIFAGRKLTRIEKEGAISYGKAIKELAPNADLEKWRGKPSTYWKMG